MMTLRTNAAVSSAGLAEEEHYHGQNAHAVVSFVTPINCGFTGTTLRASRSEQFQMCRFRHREKKRPTRRHNKAVTSCVHSIESFIQIMPIMLVTKSCEAAELLVTKLLIESQRLKAVCIQEDMLAATSTRL